MHNEDLTGKDLIPFDLINEQQIYYHN